MSEEKLCYRHNLPNDICGPCNAAREERERIIALLEDPRNKDEWVLATRNTVGTFGNTVSFLVALIKGEN